MPEPVVPEGVTRIDHVWIPLSDGTRLAARIWLPEGAERAGAGLLEAIPYRKYDSPPSPTPGATAISQRTATPRAGRHPRQRRFRRRAD